MTRTAPALPFTPPSWLTPAGVALAVIAAGSALVAPAAVDRLDLAKSELGEGRATRLAVALVTMLLSVALARRALRALSVYHAVLWCIVGGLGYGVLNGGLSFAAVTFVDGKPFTATLAALPLGMLFGCPFGGGLGLCFGVVFSFVIAPAVRARLHPSHEGLDRTMLCAGAVLALTAAVITRTAYAAPAIVALIAGTCLFFAGLCGTLGRRLWLRAVAAGRAPGWSIEGRPEAERGEELVGFLRDDYVDAVLMYRGGGAVAPYRERDPAVATALVRAPR